MKVSARWAIAVLLVACVDEKSKSKPIIHPPEPSATVDPSPMFDEPKPEGCQRSGSLDALAMDPSCAIDRANDDVNRDAMKRVSLELAPDVPSIPAGTNVIFRLVMTNTSKEEVALVFDVPKLSTGIKPDWTRLGGVPEPKGVMSDAYRLSFHVRTLDAREHNVDGLPQTLVPEPMPVLVRIRLKPGDKLTHPVSWWAMRIPAPMPIYRDDAGRRIVPKTAPTLLPAGDYFVSVDVPLHGLCPAECAVRAPIRVERATLKP